MASGSTSKWHVLAIPYPGRGHVNSMVNACRRLAVDEPGLVTTMVATEEWVAALASDLSPSLFNFQLRSIPNVLPSEKTRGNDWPAFFEAVSTKMEAPVASLLDDLHKPVACIVADSMLSWAVALGKRRSIPVVSVWVMSSTMLLSIFNRLEAPIHVEDWKSNEAIRIVTEAVSCVAKADGVLIASFHELEPHATDAIKTHLQSPVYTVGPSIPYMPLHDRSTETTAEAPTNVDYLKWLESKPRDSVVYVSFGSLWVVSEEQVDEIAAGLRGSGAHFLWSARANSQHLEEICGERGLVVGWCDQLRVLCHPSVGAFFTHCGWNSTMEGVFAGVVILAFPLAADQPINAKLMVEDWKIGVRLRREEGGEGMVKSEEIAGAVKKVMDLEGNEGREMRSRAERLAEACKTAIGVGGSSNTNIKAFVKRFVHGHHNDGSIVD